VSGSTESLVDRLWRAAFVVLATAIVLNAAWQLLQPLLPALIVLFLVAAVFKLAYAGRRRW
jgi:hypothetical protein